ncbi:MAG: S-layer homology domain-containing protein [Clostridia bacterium]|nr:S-layer homology domain-containing protein [Clostridia bacterium]
MMKKIISLVICLSTILGAVAYAQENEENTVMSEQLKTIVELGIISQCEPEEYVTRGAFAQAVYNILTYNTEDMNIVAWDFFGKPITQTKELTNEDADEIYQDVNKNLDSYEAITALSQCGLMEGITARNFGPDENMEINRALRMIEYMMGYKSLADAYGAYPIGVGKLAAQLKLNNGIKASSHFTYEDLARLITNAFDVKMYGITSSGVSASFGASDETMLEKYLGLKKLEGFVTQNDIFDIEKGSSDYINSVKINGIVLNTKQCEYMQEYAGRNVRCYYGAEDSKYENQIVYGYLFSNEKYEKTISIEDVEGFSGEYVEYLDENNIVKRIKISSPVRVIVNGELRTSYDDSIFDFDSGYVYFTSLNKNGIFDLVIVEGYESWFTSSVDVNTMTVFNKSYSSDDNFEDKMLCLDKNVTDKKIIVKKSSGESVEADSIISQSVINVARSSVMIKVIISDSKITGFTVKNHIRGDDGEYISDGSNKYKLSKSLKNAELKADIGAGSTVDIYLDYFGKVAWIVKTNNTGWKISYLSKFFNNEEDDKTTAKIFVSDKQFENYVLADKATLYNEDDEKITLGKSNALNNLRKYTNTVIRYKLNDKDEITTVEIPLTNPSKTKKTDRLTRIFVASENESDDNYYGKYTFVKERGYITVESKVFMTDKNSTFISVPMDKSNYQKYFYTSVNDIQVSEGSKQFAFSAYSTNPQGIMAEYVTLTIDAKTTISGDGHLPMVVTSVTQELDYEDNPCTKIVGYYNGAEKVIYDLMTNDYANNAEDYSKTGEKYSVGKGDIVFFSTDSEGYLSYLRIVVDADGKYDNSKYGIDDYFGFNEKGTLAGTIGYWRNDIGNTNPNIGLNGKVNANNAYKFNSGYPRFLWGYVYDVQDEIVIVTTQNLHESQYDEKDTRFVTEGRCLTGNVIYVKYDNGNVTAQKGSIANVKSYKDYGTNCSRILVMSWLYAVRNFIVVDGNM